MKQKLRRHSFWNCMYQFIILEKTLKKYHNQSIKFNLIYRAAGGELQAILDEEGSITEEKTRICIREVLKALEYLHRRHVAHLDIKPQNILLNTNNLEGE